MAYFSFLPNVFVGKGVSDNEAFKYRLVKKFSEELNLDLT